MKTQCPFCEKAKLKKYPLTLYTPNYEQEPYDTTLNKACNNCRHCPEMEKALNRNEYHNLKEFYLTLVNGRGELKSIKIVFSDNFATILTTPHYKETIIPTPFIIGENETHTLKARLYGVHAELWAEMYSTNIQAYTWWELSLKFVDKPDIIRRGTDRLPPQWNKLIKIIGVYYEWLYKDSSYSLMFKLKYNFKTRELETPQNTCLPFTDFWEKVKDIPVPIELPKAEDIPQHSRVCIYSRSNILGQASTAKKQIKDCNDFCRLLKLTVVEKYVDEGVSGIGQIGDELKRLIREVKDKQIKFVIISSFSRYSRDISKAAKVRKMLEECNVKTIVLPPKKWGYWLNY